MIIVSWTTEEIPPDSIVQVKTDAASLAINPFLIKHSLTFLSPSNKIMKKQERYVKVCGFDFFVFTIFPEV